MSYLYPGEMCIRKKNEDTKGAFKSYKSKKNRQHNGQKEKVQKDEQQSTKHTHKTKDRVTRTRVLWNGKQFLLHVRRPSCECQQNIHIFIRCGLHF